MVNDKAKKCPAVSKSMKNEQAEMDPDSVNFLNVDLKYLSKGKKLYLGISYLAELIIHGNMCGTCPNFCFKATVEC